MAGNDYTQMSLFDEEVADLSTVSIDYGAPAEGVAQTSLWPNAARDGASQRAGSKSAPARPQRIDDFGKKIGMARKDLYGAGTRAGGNARIAPEDMAEMSDSELERLATKQAIWPREKWARLVEEGLPLETAWLRKTLHGSLPATPRVERLTGDERRARIEQYVRYVSALRDVANSSDDPAELARVVPTALEDLGFVRQYGMSLLPASDGEHFVSNKTYKAMRAAAQPWRLRADAEKAGFTLSPAEREASKWEYYEVASVTRNESTGKTRVVIKAGSMEGHIDIAERRLEQPELAGLRPGTWLVYRSGVGIGATGFGTRQEAEEYVVNTRVPQDREAKARKPRKTAYAPIHKKEILREGPKTRDGHITTDAYIADLNLYGGEFGEWLRTDEERQTHLDMSYDAFCDLALAYGTPLSDMSLGGRLGIGFGSRGRGRALAHYEPALNVINLTRMRGAGSLAHECIHALDDYVGFCVGHDDLASKMDRGRLEDRMPSLARLIDTLKWESGTISEERARLQGIAEQRERSLAEAVELAVGKRMPREMNLGDISALVKDYVSELREADAYDPQSEALGRLVSACKDAFLKASYSTADSYWTSRFEHPARQVISAHRQARVPDSEVCPRRRKTQYYLDALELDNLHSKQNQNGSKSRGYWSSDEELLARAGAAWVADRLEAMGIRDDYLCGNAENHTVQVGGPTGVSTLPCYYEDGMVMASRRLVGGDGRQKDVIEEVRREELRRVIHHTPQGAERERVAEAFEDFIEEMKQMGYLSHRTELAALLDESGTLHFCEAPWPVVAGEVLSFTGDDEYVYEGMAFPVPEDGESPEWLAFAGQIRYVDMHEPTGRIDARGWFEGCENLTHADLAGMGDGSDISRAFAGCTSLASVSLPHRHDLSEYPHEGAFEGCERLFGKARGRASRHGTTGR